MHRLDFPTSASAALKGAEAVVFAAPQRALVDGWLANVCDAPWARLLTRAATEAEAGEAGSLVTTLNPDEGPKTLHLIALPDTRSRNNTPARSVEFWNQLRSAGLTGSSKVTIFCCAEDPEHMLPLATAVARAFPTYSRKTGDATKKGKKKTSKTAKVVFFDGDGIKQSASKTIRCIADGTRFAASLVDHPTQELNTSDFVKAVRKEARGVENLTVKVIAGDALLEKKMGGLHAVGRTGIDAPRLMILEYTPAKKARRKVALIGKGVVYDTGGLSLKVGGSMAGMKCDMGGAAAMAGAALALAKAGTKDHVICACGLVENAIGPTAYRPDDILEMHSGHTVEINNTDAEGRLVLADASSYIARRFKPDVLIDAATLTGAALVSTGVVHAAVVSNRDGIEARAIEAGRASGDLVAPLPFAPEFFQKEFASKVADMKNSVANRMNAQTSCAAQFIYSHIDDLDIPWLHIDLAGPAWRDERGTGYGVALVGSLLDRLSKDDLAV